MSPGFSGFVYRHHSKNIDPLSNVGSLFIPGRWNRERRYGAIYTSLDKATLRAEFDKFLFDTNMRAMDLFSRAVSKIEVRLSKVLDLTNRRVRGRYNITENDMVSDTARCIERCRRVADMSIDRDYEAIITPSAANPLGKNLTIYLEKLLTGSHIRKVRTDSLLRI